MPELNELDLFVSVTAGYRLGIGRYGVEMLMR